MAMYIANGIISMWAVIYILATYTKYLVLHLHVHSPKFILQFLSKFVVWIIHLLKVRKSDRWSGQSKRNKRIWSFLPHRIKALHVTYGSLSSQLLNTTHAQKYNILHVSRETMPSLREKSYVKSNNCWHLLSKPGRKYRVAFWSNQSEVPLVKMRDQVSLKIWFVVCLFYSLIEFFGERVLRFT